MTHVRILPNLLCIRVPWDVSQDVSGRGVNLTADLYLVLRSGTELRISFIFRKKDVLKYTAAKTFKTKKKECSCASTDPQVFMVWCFTEQTKNITLCSGKAVNP